MQSTEFTAAQIKVQSYVAARIGVEQRADGFTPCWIWKLACNAAGYGISYTPLGTRAHRASYAAYVAPIPEGLHIDHLCYVRACVNPDHLEAVASSENMRRAIAHDAEVGGGHWERRELCTAGKHRMEGDNVRWITVRNQPARRCAACKSDYNDRYYLEATGKSPDDIQRNAMPKGSGSIYQRASDGRWCVAVPMPAVDGVRKRKVLTGATREQVAEKLASLAVGN